MTKVLSLFDWMSCWKIALERAWKIINKYYASEIDKNAIMCSTINNPDILQLWDVKKISYNWWILKSQDYSINTWNIDLVIWWSPCQWFSFAWKQLNFQDERSILFFEYVRIINEVRPKYFLLENVKMKKEWQSIISSHVKWIEPTLINSNLVSAQDRKRLFLVWERQEDWSYVKFEVLLPEDKKITFWDIREYWLPVMSEDRVEKIKNRKAQQKPFDKIMIKDERWKVPCLTARWFNQNHSWMIVVKEEDWYRYLSRREWERCQTVPEWYTDCLSDRECSRVLWNGWTVDVLTHIFSKMDL